METDYRQLSLEILPCGAAEKPGRKKASVKSRKFVSFLNHHIPQSFRWNHQANHQVPVLAFHHCNKIPDMSYLKRKGAHSLKVKDKMWDDGGGKGICFTIGDGSTL